MRDLTALKQALWRLRKALDRGELMVRAMIRMLRWRGGRSADQALSLSSDSARPQCMIGIGVLKDFGAGHCTQDSAACGRKFLCSIPHTHTIIEQIVLFRLPLDTSGQEI